jgi:hypothetical protein
MQKIPFNDFLLLRNTEQKANVTKRIFCFSLETTEVCTAAIYYFCFENDWASMVRDLYHIAIEVSQNPASNYQ